MSITYADLLKLTNQKDVRVQKWREDLFDQANTFATELEKRLAPPSEVLTAAFCSDRWHPFQLSQPVEEAGRPMIYRRLKKGDFEQFISKGALRFNIVLSFKEGQGIRTSAGYCLVKYDAGTPKFAFNIEVEDALTWYSLEDAVNTYLERTVEMMCFDPYAGSQKKPIGFVAN